MEQTQRQHQSHKQTSLAAGLSSLREYRCDCGKLLFKGLLLNGILELKCKRCNILKKFSFFAPSANASDI